MRILAFFFKLYGTAVGSGTEGQARQTGLGREHRRGPAGGSPGENGPPPSKYARQFRLTLLRNWSPRTKQF